MKSVKDLREQYDLITEKEEAESRKLTALVRAGLFDAKKLPALKKAMEKGVDKMSAAEKRMLINLLDSLMSQVLSNQPVYQKVKQNVQRMDEAKVEYLSKLDPRFEKKYSEKDIPTVLILKRKAVRVYPDFQKVALYYAQAIDKYVSIPFGEINVGGLNENSSSGNPLPQLSNTVILPSSGKEVTLGKKVATKKVARNKNSKVGRLRDLSRSIEKLDPISKFSYNLGRKHRKMIMSYLKNKKSASSSSVPSSATPKSAPTNQTYKMPYSGSKPEAWTNAEAQKKVNDAAAERTAKMKAKYSTSQSTAAGFSFKHRLEEMRMIKRNQEQIDEGTVKDFAYGDLDDNSISSIAKDLTPGLGTARAASRTKRDWQKGNYGSAALNAVDTALSGASDAALAVPVLGTVASGAIKAGLGAVKGLGAGYKAYKAYRTAKAASKVNKATDTTKSVKAIDKAADTTKVTDKAVDTTKATKATDKAVEKTAKDAARRKEVANLAKSRRLEALKKSSKSSKLSKLGKAARIGAAGLGAAGALGAAAAGAAAPKPTDQNYNFGNINKTVTSSDSFTQKNPTTDAQAQRDYQAQKRANQAMGMHESTASQKLRSRRKLGKNIGTALSGTANALSSISSTTKSTDQNYNFGNINKTVTYGNSLSNRNKDHNPAQAQRDYQAQKRANQAQAQQYESVYVQLKNMVESEMPSIDISYGDSPITINNTVAKKIVNLHESVNKSNKKKMEKMLNESASSFNKVLTFALRY